MSFSTSNSIARPAESILVVDDTPANLKLLTIALRSYGYEVRPVLSGEAALEALQRKLPDLILLDINLPGMDGYEVCSRLKSDPHMATVPIIFISARDDTFDKVKGLELGAVDYVTKPIRLQEVEARVRTHLELAHLRYELEQHNLRLEELVSQRTRQLSESHALLVQAHARLAVLDQSKSDFLQIIAHEVRTPLTGIFGISELLLGECPPDFASRFSPLLEQSRRRLLTLTEDALLLSRIGVTPSTGAEAFWNLAVLLEDARSNVVPFAKSRGVELAIVPQDIGMGFGEPEYLTRALQSLLETAVKFADNGSCVQISTESGNKEIRLCFEAHGFGIPLDVLPRFFHLLGISETLTPGGDLGLAPYMAERILALYGGTVSVESLDPPGIRLTLSMKAPAGTPNDARQTPTQSLNCQEDCAGLPG